MLYHIISLASFESIEELSDALSEAITNDWHGEILLLNGVKIYF